MTHNNKLYNVFSLKTIHLFYKEYCTEFLNPHLLMLLSSASFNNTIFIIPDTCALSESET